MIERKCPFTLIIRADRAGCSRAELVTWREGPGVDCGAPESWTRCGELLERLKTVGLPAFDVADDPLVMPQAVLTKIQLGGFTGLRDLLETPAPPQARPRSGQDEADIDGLLDIACGRFGAVAAIPVERLVGAMKQVESRRRRG